MIQLQSSDKIMTLYYAVNVQCLYSCPTSELIKPLNEEQLSFVCVVVLLLAMHCILATTHTLSCWLCIMHFQCLYGFLSLKFSHHPLVLGVSETPVSEL